MPTIPYDASRNAVYQPGRGKSIFPVTGKLEDELLCAECSRIVYKHFETQALEKAELEEALRSVGFSEIEYFNRGGSQAFGAVNPQNALALISFRGTEGDKLADLWDDADALWAPWEGGGHVHEGFKGALDRIWDGVRAWLEAQRGRRLLLTGHSLGAALATVAAARLDAGARSGARLVTFGSPRVGDQDFVNSLKNFPSTRYVDCCDLVCHVPPGNVRLDGKLFVHLEPQIYIDRNGQVATNAGDPFVQKDRRKGREDYLLDYAWKRGTVLVRDLADHAPINYVRALL